jgi:ribosomal protein L44E
MQRPPPGPEGEETTMQVNIEFTCPKCGLWTPGNADVPEGENPKRPVTLKHECFHCGSPLETTAKVGALLAAGRRGEWYKPPAA